MSETACSWCGVVIGADEGYRATEPERARHAAFCRLEHVVPWSLRGAKWEAGSDLDADDPGEGLGRCAQCGDALGYDRIVLVRHRGQFRIGDAFCGPDHLQAWATAGGRWAVG
jgi:hypothetical protein